MIINRQIRVRGKVQGVFFRKYTKEKAREIGLAGFVYNDNDGSVYIEVSGPAEKVRAFTEWCQIGSPFSKVDTVEVLEHDDIHTGLFSIR